VLRTFADGVKTYRSRSRRGTGDRRVPTGLIHAAAGHDPIALCGRDLGDLHEFGQARFPFEHFPQERRCQACDDVASSP
jgi:hypothetical protein